jgi:hypothetical protein
MIFEINLKNNTKKYPRQDETSWDPRQTGGMRAQGSRTMKWISTARWKPSKKVLGFLQEGSKK